MATKKVVFKHNVEEVKTDFVAGKGRNLNRNQVGWAGYSPVEDLGQGSSIQFQDEGVDKGENVTTVNFKGAGVTITEVSPTELEVAISSGGSGATIGTNNGATFRYYTLTGTPTVTYDTSTADQPVLSVAGGTIKLIELWVPYNGSSGGNPIWTINGTVSSSRAISTPIVTKIIENSTTPSIAGTYNQADIDSTPQVRYGDYTATSVKVQLASVTGTWNFGFLFTMNQ